VTMIEIWTTFFPVINAARVVSPYNYQHKLLG
jgi:hypothetical protein